MTTIFLGSEAMSVEPAKWVTVRGNTASATPDPIPSGTAVGPGESPTVSEGADAADDGADELSAALEQAETDSAASTATIVARRVRFTSIAFRHEWLGNAKLA
ncbi:hypothetical protein GCM10007304_17040 [Rhodococcoides trifolii]|uniref:Uncharacterized protein n=1 Tax=Rhodococcoides trifolii TaxID=908250 RepID=A0A917CZ19_9NOCA|nr:hypothetical protein GCM10007304_17040 [Rhodococcus trifolii]